MKLCGHALPVEWNRIIKYRPKKWADALLGEIGGNGYEMRDVQESVEQVKAGLEGQMAECEFQYEPFGQKWKA